MRRLRGIEAILNFIRKRSMLAKKLIEDASGWEWIEMVHQSQPNGWLDRLFWKRKEVQASRTKLELVKKKVRELIEERIAERVTIISLGCGSGRDIIETLSKLDRTTEIEAICVDIDPKAIAKAKELAENQSVADNILFQVADLNQVIEESTRDEKKYDIVMAVGVLEFMKDLGEFFVRIGNILAPAGTIVTTQIRSTLGPFPALLNKCFGIWCPVYRSREELEKTLSKVFEEVTVEYEPKKVYSIAIGKGPFLASGQAAS